MLNKNYDYEEFYFAELLRFLDIGKEVVELLLQMECDTKNTPTKNRFLGYAYDKIGKYAEAESYEQLYLNST